MARNRTQAKHKHYILDEAKVKRAQKLLGTNKHSLARPAIFYGIVDKTLE